MRKIVFLLCALFSVSTINGFFIENENAKSETENVASAPDVIQSQTEKSAEEVENKEIAELFAEANKSIRKAKSTVLTLTRKLKENGVEIKNSTVEFHDYYKKYVKETAEKWMATAPGIDVQECYKYVTIYEDKVAAAIQKVNECVDSTEESVDNFIQTVDQKCNFISQNLALANENANSCTDNKNCVTKIKEQTSKIVENTVSEINSEIVKFTLKSIYYHPKLKFCSAIDDFKLWLQTPGVPTHKVRICVRDKKKQAKQ